MLFPSIKVEKLLRAVADGDLEMVSFSETVFLITLTKCLVLGTEEKEGWFTVSKFSVPLQRQLGGGIMRHFAWGGPRSIGEPEAARGGHDLQGPVPSAGLFIARSRLLRAPQPSGYAVNSSPVNEHQNRGLHGTF